MNLTEYVNTRAAELEAELKKADTNIAVLERQKRAVEAQLENAYANQAQIAGALTFARELARKGEEKDVPPIA